MNGAERAVEKGEEAIDFDVTLSAVATAGVETSGVAAPCSVLALHPLPIQCSDP